MVPSGYGVDYEPPEDSSPTGDLLTVRIQTESGIECEYLARPDDPITSLKVAMYLKPPAGVAIPPPSCSSLFFSGTELLNHHTLREHGVQDSALLLMVMEEPLHILVQPEPDQPSHLFSVWSHEKVEDMQVRIVHRMLRDRILHHQTLSESFIWYSLKRRWRVIESDGGWRMLEPTDKLVGQAIVDGNVLQLGIDQGIVAYLAVCS